MLKHFGTTIGVFNEDDILILHDIIIKGECTSVKNKFGHQRHIYKHFVDGVKYTVVTDVSKGREVFCDFYTNQKARPLSKRMATADTLISADAYSGNAFSAAKVQQNSEITKENETFSVVVPTFWNDLQERLRFHPSCGKNPQPG